MHIHEAESFRAVDGWQAKREELQPPNSTFIAILDVLRIF
jgi:hypothetical protein